jgi:hypothetical protein
MDIGSLVYNRYDGLLRFGVIVEKLVGNHGWTHFEINWIEDEAYERAMAWREKLCASRHTPKELYRADEVHPIDGERLAAVAHNYRRL